MNKCRGTLFRTIATRAVIAVIPAAMVSAYASGIFISPPRMAAYDYIQVAEITRTSNTIGMAESPLYGMSQADIDATLDQLQSIGVQNIRVFVPWGLIEQQDNSYDFSLLDRVMTAAAARNMGVMAEVNGTPSFAGPNPGNPGFPPGSDTPNVQKFVDFMQAFMAHQITVNGAVVNYASVVSAYEIWNEPNYIVFSNPISPEAYATLLAAIYPVIKTVDPTATVVAGAVGATQDSLFTMDPVEFVQRMLTALGPNALNLFDALSIHPYGDQIAFSGSCSSCPDSMLTPREQVEAIMAMIGTKKVWLSEYGVASTDAASYEQQATWIKDLLDTWQNYAQAGPVFIYTGRDSAGTAPGQTWASGRRAVARRSTR
jgi:endo-1,4-beta-mannosidase